MDQKIIGFFIILSILGACSSGKKNQIDLGFIPTPDFHQFQLSLTNNNLEFSSLNDNTKLDFEFYEGDFRTVSTQTDENGLPRSCYFFSEHKVDASKLSFQIESVDKFKIKTPDHEGCLRVVWKAKGKAEAAGGVTVAYSKASNVVSSLAAKSLEEIIKPLLAQPELPVLTRELAEQAIQNAESILFNQYGSIQTSLRSPLRITGERMGLYQVESEDAKVKFLVGFDQQQALALKMLQTFESAGLKSAEPTTPAAKTSALRTLMEERDPTHLPTALESNFPNLSSVTDYVGATRIENWVGFSQNQLKLMSQSFWLGSPLPHPRLLPDSGVPDEDLAKPLEIRAEPMDLLTGWFRTLPQMQGEMHPIYGMGILFSSACPSDPSLSSIGGDCNFVDRESGANGSLFQQYEDYLVKSSRGELKSKVFLQGDGLEETIPASYTLNGDYDDSFNLKRSVAIDFDPNFPLWREHESFDLDPQMESVTIKNYFQPIASYADANEAQAQLEELRSIWEEIVGVPEDGLYDPANFKAGFNQLMLQFYGITPTQICDPETRIQVGYDLDLSLNTTNLISYFYSINCSSVLRSHDQVLPWMRDFDQIAFIRSDLGGGARLYINLQSTLTMNYNVLRPSEDAQAGDTFDTCASSGSYQDRAHLRDAIFSSPFAFIFLLHLAQAYPDDFNPKFFHLGQGARAKYFVQNIDQISNWIIAAKRNFEPGDEKFIKIEGSLGSDQLDERVSMERDSAFGQLRSVDLKPYLQSLFSEIPSGIRKRIIQNEQGDYKLATLDLNSFYAQSTECTYQNMLNVDPDTGMADLNWDTRYQDIVGADLCPDSSENNLPVCGGASNSDCSMMYQNCAPTDTVEVDGNSYSNPYLVALDPVEITNQTNSELACGTENVILSYTPYSRYTRYQCDCFTNLNPEDVHSCFYTKVENQNPCSNVSSQFAYQYYDWKSDCSSAECILDGVHSNGFDECHFPVPVYKEAGYFSANRFKVFGTSSCTEISRFPEESISDLPAGLEHALANSDFSLRVLEQEVFDSRLEQLQSLDWGSRNIFALRELSRLLLSQNRFGWISQNSSWSLINTNEIADKIPVGGTSGFSFWGAPPQNMPVRSLHGEAQTGLPFNDPESWPEETDFPVANIQTDPGYRSNGDAHLYRENLPLKGLNISTDTKYKILTGVFAVIRDELGLPTELRSLAGRLWPFPGTNDDLQHIPAQVERRLRFKLNDAVSSEFSWQESKPLVTLSSPSSEFAYKLWADLADVPSDSRTIPSSYIRPAYNEIVNAPSLIAGVQVESGVTQLNANNIAFGSVATCQANHIFYDGSHTCYEERTKTERSYVQYNQTIGLPLSCEIGDNDGGPNWNDDGGWWDPDGSGSDDSGGGGDTGPGGNNGDNGGSGDEGDDQGGDPVDPPLPPDWSCEPGQMEVAGECKACVETSFVPPLEGCGCSPNSPESSCPSGAVCAPGPNGPYCCDPSRENCEDFPPTPESCDPGEMLVDGACLACDTSLGIGFDGSCLCQSDSQCPDGAQCVDDPNSSFPGMGVCVDNPGSGGHPIGPGEPIDPEVQPGVPRDSMP